MKKFETLKEVEAELLQYVPNRMYEADYKLQRVKKLLDQVGNPQNSLRVIHIGGTSGKTSTAYYVRALLEAAGARTGMTVSPHIVSTCERLQLDGSPVSEEIFARYFTEFYEKVEHIEPKPTYFELLTAFVYWVFAKEHVDYAVVEVGLGGRYDATNVVERADKVPVINSVGLDHTEILGETLTEIAGEKAGIILPGNTVYTVTQEPEAMKVIRHEAKKQNADLHVVTPQVDSQLDIPEFQQRNAQLAFAVVLLVAQRDGLKLPGDAKTLLRDVSVPGRYEMYRIGEKSVILDGAHNPQKLRALFSALEMRVEHPVAAVAAFSEAPVVKIESCVKLVKEFAERVEFTTFTVQRDVLRRSADLSLYGTVAEPQDALEKALAGSEPTVVVTGSLYLVSMLRPFVQQLAASAK